MAGQPTPYLGSKISLISKSEIRYEGILYTVDTKESTISLAKVQSFGTEDRPTEHPVAARDEVYEYIIFKASDIKDLMVCETPKPVPQMRPGLPYDPAIVTMSQPGGSSLSSTLAGQAAAMGQHSAHSPQGKARGFPQSGSSSRSETPQQRLGGSPHNEAPNAWASRAPGAGRNNSRGAPNHGPPQNQNRREPPYEGQRGGIRQQGANMGHRQEGYGYANREPMGPRGGYGGGGMGFPRGGGFRGGMDRGMGAPRGGGWIQVRGRGNQQQNRPRQQSDSSNQGQKPPLKFDGDYDFETANEQFQETLSNLKDEMVKVKLSEDDEGSEGGGETKKEEKQKDDSGTETGVGDSEEQGDDEENPEFYDKKKSFFDRISCEALERQEGKNTRPNWKVERQTNLETFGQSAVRNYQYRRGGRGFGGRGYGGRGGGYNRGGGYRTYSRGGSYNNNNRY